jgi:hypothetical protein
MDLNVLFQIRPRCELFLADFTFVRFFSRMYSLVPDQIGYLANRYNLNNFLAYLGEGLIASVIATLERLSLVVHPSMLLKARVLGEGLIT